MSNISARGFARSVQARQRLVHQIHVKLTGTGTAALNHGGNEVTLTDNGTGDYTLTLRTAAQRILAVHATPATANTAVVVGTVTTSAVQLLATDLANSAQDAVMYVTIVVSDVADEV
jgi:hypothetical protein